MKVGFSPLNLIANLAAALVLLPGSAAGTDLLPFEPGDSLEEIRYKIDYNGYSFTVADNWVFSMAPEEKAAFFSRYRPLTPRRHSVHDEIGPLENFLGKGAIPSKFDWRNYNGRSYIGPVRDQGACGSCYAFGAAAAAEGSYNWMMGKYDTNRADFSEAFIAFCLSDHYTGFDGCGGASYAYDELQALMDYGICAESDYPYSDYEQSCPFTAYPPLTQFKSWHRVPCNDIEAIKTAIMTYGVVDAAVYVGSAFQAYAGGVYEDTNTECTGSPCSYTTSNHAIALVGWDDNPPEGGGGCWILRNSWGANWGEGGYMRIRYTSAVVACAVSYLVYEDSGSGALKIASFNVSKVGTIAGEETIRTFKGLKPDIALLQEWGMAAGAHRGYVDEAFGPQFYYYLGWAPEFFGPGSAMNNGIVSRWTITNSGFWKDVVSPNNYDSVAWAEIDLPGDTDLLAVSLHLKAGDTAQDKADRVTQANAVKSNIESYKTSQGFNGYVVVGGDFNFANYEDGALTVFSTFLSPTNHLPADHLGNKNTNQNRNRPYDWVMPDPALDSKHTPLVIGTENYRYPDGIVFDSHYFWAQGDYPVPSPDTELWNLPPVRYGDSHSSNTDHMAVMKAFDAGLGPAPTPAPIAIGSISGRVYDRVTGQGISGVYVTGIGGMAAAGVSDRNGYYRTGTLNAGSYLAYADTWNRAEYRSQYYNQKDNADQAWRVSSNTGGVDFPLYRKWVYPTPTPAPTPQSLPSWLPSSIDTADYDGDGTSDLAVFRTSSGLWAVKGVTRAYFGKGGDIPIPGDYNGDGTSDLAVFREASGLWAIRGITRIYFGVTGDLPIPGDYSGTGSAGFAVFRPSTGIWAIRNLTRVYFGRPGDIPAPFRAGSGTKKEIAVFRRDNGLWAVRGVTKVFYGSVGDLPVPGDYAGDGTAAAAVFRDSSGLWAVRGGNRIYFGKTGDLPVPGNYRGRSSADIAVFRPSAGLWAARNSTRVYFGRSGDRPVSGLAVNPSGAGVL